MDAFPVHKTSFCEAMHFIQDDVLCNTGIGDKVDFLVYNADAAVYGVFITLEMQFFAIQDNRTLVGLINTTDDFHQCAFTGTVFTQDRVNLALPKVNGNILQRFDAGKMFRNMF